MDKQTAVGIIRDAFENPFDKGRFVHFAKNLLNKIDETKAFHAHGVYIPESFKDYVRAYERIGTYTDPTYPRNNKIDVLIVYLQKETSLERARTSQRNFVARYLEDRGEKEAGLVAFVSPDPSDWRFSLVKMEYKLAETPTGKVKIKEEFTPARRWSFLVGKNESSHTAQSQLVDILADDKNNPTLCTLENAFNIEVATREFFNSYRELFNKVKEELDNLVATDNIIRQEFDNKGIDKVSFAKKLLGQIVFLYFLQKKGWLGVQDNKNWGDGDKKFLRNLFEKCRQEKRNFFNDYLEYLFYDALNKQDRGGVDSSYYQRFDCRIPFLNGGLFDSDYEWVKTDIVIPNDIFSSRKDAGDEGSGILDVFDLYNFTVKEDEPLEKEVAVDPEMLGKVFENLLEVKHRKSKGTYYTPREIVHYMCQESLINYLDSAINTVNVPLAKTRPPQGKLFAKPDPEQATLETTEYRVVVPREELEDFVCKGEFAVEHDARVEARGKETERYSYRIPETIRQNAKLIDEKLADIRVCDPAVGSGAFLVSLMTDIVKARNTLTTYLTSKEGRTTYNFKRHAIQNCLYGVDIDPGAIEIAKLRLWLSLVVDEEDIKQIQPLPNLDYKIVCGNSLLGVEKNLFNVDLLNELERLKPLYFNETNAKKKREYKRQIDHTIKDLTNNNETFDFEVYFSEVFHQKGGFDVVIANPPYVEFKNLSKELKQVLTGYQTAHGKYDLYIPFIEKSGAIMNKDGISVFICPTRFMKRDYGSSLRKWLSKNYRVIELVDFVDLQMFECAMNYTGILIFGHKSYRDSFEYKCFISEPVSSLQLEHALRSHEAGELAHVVSIPNSAIYSDVWTFSDASNQTLISKIKINSLRLSDLCMGIFQGISTGKDSVFVVNEQTIEQYDIERDIVVPFLKGKDIGPYSLRWSGNYLIYPYNRDGTVYTESVLRNAFPNTYRYLSSKKDELKGRQYFDDSAKRWYELWNQRNLDRFLRLKILTLDNARRNSFCLDRGTYIGTTTTYSIILKDESLKRYLYVLGVLNSSLIEYYHKKNTIPQAGGFYRYQAIFIKSLPIKFAHDIHPVANIVDQILAITKDEDYRTNPTKQARVKELERQIDQLVYQLYDLTPEEIAVVQNEVK